MPLSRIFAALVLILITCVPALPRCERTTPAERFEFADVVFRGRVSNIGFGWFSTEEQVTFTVEQSWKGIASDHVVVYTNSAASPEEPRFQSGESYIVYANRNGAKLYPGLCSEIPVKEAGAELVDLSKRTVIPITKTISSDRTRVFAVTSIMVLLLLAAVYTVRVFIKRAA